MIQRLPTSPGFAGRSSQKNEVFSKNRGLAAFVQATAWQAASVTAAFSPIRRLASLHLFAD
jgi:hypothetical protein